MAVQLRPRQFRTLANGVLRLAEALEERGWPSATGGGPRSPRDLTSFRFVACAKARSDYLCPSESPVVGPNAPCARSWSYRWSDMFSMVRDWPRVENGSARKSRSSTVVW